MRPSASPRNQTSLPFGGGGLRRAASWRVSDRRFPAESGLIVRGIPVEVGVCCARKSEFLVRAPDLDAESSPWPGLYLVFLESTLLGLRVIRLPRTFFARSALALASASIMAAGLASPMSL